MKKFKTDPQKKCKQVYEGDVKVVKVVKPKSLQALMKNLRLGNRKMMQVTEVVSQKSLGDALIDLGI